MQIELFWDLIQKSKLGVEDCDKQAKKLTALLSKLESHEIISFDEHFRHKLIEAYRWDLWAVAYIINGGCSDDGFTDFRGWLISQGEEYFKSALADPENAARKIADSDDAFCESILYASRYAYEKKTGDEMPFNIIELPAEPAGEPWDEDKVELLFPKLASKFGYG